MMILLPIISSCRYAVAVVAYDATDIAANMLILLPIISSYRYAIAVAWYGTADNVVHIVVAVATCFCFRRCCKYLYSCCSNKPTDRLID